MAPIAELIRGDGTIAKSLRFSGDVKVIPPGQIFVNTENGHEVLASFGNKVDETLRITSDADSLVVDGLYPTVSVTIPPQTDLVIHHDAHHETEAKPIPELA